MWTEPPPWPPQTAGAQRWTHNAVMSHSSVAAAQAGPGLHPDTPCTTGGLQEHVGASCKVW